MSDIRARPSTSTGGYQPHGDNFSEKNSTTLGEMDQMENVNINESKDMLIQGEFLEDEHSDSKTDTQVIRVFGRSINIVIAVTHVNIFLYAACFWIQNAVFPYLSKQMGADPVTFGYLQTTFAIVQLAGGPLFGRFGDLFGSRLAMIMAFVAAALSYFSLYLATSIPLLFLSRLPSVFMHAMQGGQMIVVDVCDSKERASALGKLGLSYGLGMVAGTLVGGVLSNIFRLETAAFIAFLGSILSIVLIYVNVPSTVKKVKTTETNQESVFSITKILQILKAPGALFLLSIKLATGIPIGIFQSMFSIIALETFQLTADKNSYMMTYIGVLSMLTQGFAVNQVTKRFSNLTILTGSTALLCASYFSLSLVTSIVHMCVVFPPLVIGLTIQNVITTSALTNTVSSADTGAMLGLSMAIHSLIRAVSPTFGGYMLRSLGFSSYGHLGFVTSAIVLLILLFKLRGERREIQQ